eukprot:Hpha_TRINITY_DN15571_c2_g12::TRINITY_DN15571_c2_g12_i1::g.106270::m.106270
MSEIKGVLLALPVAWFLWDVCGPSRLFTERWWPFISSFKREWKKSPSTQATHLKAFANLLLFCVLVYELNQDPNDPRLRSASPQERGAINRGIEQAMHVDFERHSSVMDTLTHKHAGAF